MKLITVRHGQTKGNNSGLTQGWMKGELAELDDEGIKQAEKVAERLKDEKIDVIYSSDLERASRTAEEIAKYHDCELILDKRLREQKKGIYEGGSAKKMWDVFRAQGEDIIEWVPEGGESMGSVRDRVMDFFNEIEQRYKDKTVLVVSHGGPVAVLSRHFHKDLGFGEEAVWGKHKHKNTAVSEYILGENECKINKFNCVEHLE